jgi:hypothetical protein
MSSVAVTDLLARESSDPVQELSGFERVKAIYEVGEKSVVVETTEGREVRITAWLDRLSGQYVADFERRGTVTHGNQQLRVWAHTNAHERVVADDASACLEAAIREVDRVQVMN